MVLVWLELAPCAADSLLRFDDEAAVARLKITGDVAQTKVSHNPAFTKSGAGTLCLVTKDIGTEERDGGMALEFHAVNLPQLAKFKALSFWIYLPADPNPSRTSLDLIRVLMNARYKKGAGDWKFPGPHLKPGWNQITCDFSEVIGDLTQLNRLTIYLNLKRGFQPKEIYLDELVLEPMEPLAKSDLPNLEKIIHERAEPWSLRYQAIDALRTIGGDAVTGALIEASRDKVDLLRAKARDSLVSMGATALPGVRRALKNDSGLIRQSAVEVLSDIGAANGIGDVLADLESAALDRNYYVRDAAITSLLKFDTAKNKIVDPMLAAVKTPGAAEPRVLAARVLSEMSLRPELCELARSTVPDLLGIVQNEREDFLLRLNSLVAVWKLNESAVPLSAWLLPLRAEPGEAHRHLLNKAMSSLETAGPAAVPLLRQTLLSPDATVRTRGAMMLAAMGTAAKPAFPELVGCLRDPKWYVRWQALKTLDVLGFTRAEMAQVLKGPVYLPTPPAPASAPVKMTEDAKGYVTLDNGLIELVFSKGGKEDGPIALRKKGETKNLIKGYGYTHWLCDRPLGGQRTFTVVAATPDRVEVAFMRPAGGEAVVDFEIHYLLRKGESGFYCYIVVRKTPDKPDMTIGFFDYLLRVADPRFRYLAANDRFQGPTLNWDKFNADEQEQIRDIFQATYRLPDGELDAKHEWNVYDKISPVIGTFGSGIGLWTIHPSFDYHGAAFPNYVNQSIAHGTQISGLDDKYYFHTGCVVTGNFEKIYGPFFMYLNSGENSAEMWIDAKRRAESEVAQWPYAWFNVGGYHERSTVTGKLTIAGGASAAGAAIILSHPDATLGWQGDRGPYMFWTRATADGSFILRNVRPGKYTLFANVDGVLGEFRKDDVAIEANRPSDLGALSWTPETHGKILWQIGVPNRTSSEFRGGNNFGQWDDFLTYRPSFPHDVDFTVGRSDYRKDWNYVQPSRAPGETESAPWKIRFNLDAPIPAKSWLTIAISSTRDATLDVLLNDKQIAQFQFPYGKEDDSAGIRTLAYGRYTQHVIPIDPTQLHAGENIITLVQPRHGNWSNVMYDCIRFETEEQPTK